MPKAFELTACFNARAMREAMLCAVGVYGAGKKRKLYEEVMHANTHTKPQNVALVDVWIKVARSVTPHDHGCSSAPVDTALPCEAFLKDNRRA
jgi:hypothetical protein